MSEVSEVSLPRKDGGRAPAVEVVPVNTAVADHDLLASLSAKLRQAVACSTSSHVALTVS